MYNVASLTILWMLSKLAYFIKNWSNFKRTEHNHVGLMTSQFPHFPRACEASMNVYTNGNIRIMAWHNSYILHFQVIHQLAQGDHPSRMSVTSAAVVTAMPDPSRTTRTSTRQVPISAALVRRSSPTWWLSRPIGASTLRSNATGAQIVERPFVLLANSSSTSAFTPRRSPSPASNAPNASPASPTYATTWSCTGAAQLLPVSWVCAQAHFYRWGKGKCRCDIHWKAKVSGSVV